MGLISTIQKREKLNNVFVIDEKSNGDANYVYCVVKNGGSLFNSSDRLLEIGFQKGARFNEESTIGVIDSDLLEIVKHRLEGFQGGEFKTKENEMALNHIEEALMWMNRRVEDRIERQVLGKEKK